MEQTDSPPRPADPDTTGPALSETALPASLSADADEDDGIGPPPDYNPADYRWVPVRRRPRADGWTEEKQRHFIEVLADTGLVNHAARAVGLSRETAYRLRRSAHGAAFARAWDAARQYAGSLIEDVAFERAIEGVEHNVYDELGEVVCTKRVYNDRLLTFLLSHLKPERYGPGALPAPTGTPPPPEVLEAELRAMEPQLPAPPERMLDPQVLAAELHLAEVADGVLPHFLREQRPAKSAARLKLKAQAAQEEHGKAVCERLDNKQVGETLSLTRQDMVDLTRYLDPASRNERSGKRFR